MVDKVAFGGTSYPLWAPGISEDKGEIITRTHKTGDGCVN